MTANGQQRLCAYFGYTDKSKKYYGPDLARSVDRGGRARPRDLIQNQIGHDARHGDGELR